ncbi:monocarboxylate transporter [Elysia marginata]|uniref:Monocarboxylate transporter n=1 Tax=Elysia marginata TaxID=1093978 RepID=A0AAV4J7V5_9GAST|nr:monocarboxylate transporter [Elysia marginata]
MPSGDDDTDSSSRSLQLKRLLESDEGSPPTSTSLTFGGLQLNVQNTPGRPSPPSTLNSSLKVPLSLGTPKSNLSKRHEPSNHSLDKAAEGLPPGVDPDTCYSWLLPSPTDPKRQVSEDSILSTSSSRSGLPVPPPPDGGWGWFVVLGAFTVSLFCDGLSYCFGVLYSELLMHFGESRSKTSMVGSIFFGVAMMLGPFASALTTRFGCRKMTIFGGLLSSFGFFLSYFATSINMLCFTFSIVVGAGFSFCYITSVVIVAFYFDKRRALATGLAVCGTGVGTFTFAPLMDFLINEYGWRLFLILSAMSLNLVVCGMLFRPLQFTETQRCQMLLEEFNKIPPGREGLETARGGCYTSDSTDTDSESSSGADGCWGGRSKSDSSTDEDDEDDKNTRSLSLLSLPTFVRNTCLVQQSPSPVLIEALRGSKNPHLTMHRYMKNAFLQLEHARLHARHARRHLSERETASSPVDPDPQTVSNLSPDSAHVSSFSRSSPRVSPTLFRRDHQLKESQDLAVTFSHPRNKPVHISEPTAHNHLASIKNYVLPIEQAVNDKGTEHKKSKFKHSQRDLEFSHHFELPSMGDALLDRPNDGSKRLSGFYVGRHNALSIHLPLYRTDIFYRRAMQRSNAFPKQPCTLGTSCPELTDPGSQLSRSRDRLCSPVYNFLDDACDVFKSMVEFRLFLNPFFSLFVVSNFIYYFWSDVPYMYAADHAMELGQDSTNASFLLSIIGIFNMIGQVVFGYIGDLDVNLLNIYATISAAAGVFVAVVPYIYSYAGMCTAYAFFGFCISVSFPLTTVLLVNYLGVARLTNAYGLLMLMQGIANLFGPPFAGWVSDKMQSYDPAFLLSGFFYVVSGLVLFLAYLPLCREFEAARSRRASLDVTVETVKDKEPAAVNRVKLKEEGSPV